MDNHNLLVALSIFTLIAVAGLGLRELRRTRDAQRAHGEKPTGRVDDLMS